MPPDIAHMKALAVALSLTDVFQRVDRLADKWIGRGWSQKKPEELDEIEKREWYDLRDSWERAVKTLKDRVARFVRDYYVSPILRFEIQKDEYGLTGKVILGFSAAQAKGYKVIDLTYPQWFQELGLQTENLAPEDVEKLAPALILTQSDRYNLRDYFDGHLREAGFSADEIFSRVTEFEKAINPLRNFNDNLLELDRLLKSIIEAKRKGPLTPDEKAQLMRDFKQKLIDAKAVTDLPPEHPWWSIFETAITPEWSYAENLRRIGETADMLIAREKRLQELVKPAELFLEPKEQDVLSIIGAGMIVRDEEFFNEVKRKGFNVPKTSELLAKLLREGTLYEPRPGFYARTETPTPPVAAPKLKPEDTAKLADFFLDKLRRGGVTLPTQYKGQFEKALDINKSYEENVVAVEKVADDIIKPVPPPVPAPARVEKLTPADQEHIWGYFITQLEDANVPAPEKYKPDFDKTIDVTKDWAENIQAIDPLIQKIIAEVGAKPVPQEVRVKVKVEEGADPGTYLATFWYDSFEAGFVGLQTTDALKDYLKDAEEYIDYYEQFRMSGFDEQQTEEELKKLPWPFSTHARLKVTWTYPQDVEFTGKTQEWLSVYEKVYSLPELEALSVEQLKDIAKIKRAKAGKNKAELIDNILATTPKREIKEVAQDALKDLEGL